MKCAWQEFIHLLPQWLRQEVDKQGREALEELRLRCDLPPELRLLNRSVFLSRVVNEDDINYCINNASHYSPWSAQTVSNGYITAPGGHRIGICGDATVDNMCMKGITHPSSICIRIARDFPGITRSVKNLKGSILIIGSPGSGKTTLLRDLIRNRSNNGFGSIAVVDEKLELFPKNGNRFCFDIGKRTDVLSGCSKAHGISTVLRNMGPDTIAVDEITENADCTALLHAGWCGVSLLATAHAANLEDLYSRPVYQPLIASRLFQTILILQPDKSWRMERICK